MRERNEERKRKKTFITLFSVVLLISILLKTFTDGKLSLDGLKKEKRRGEKRREEKKRTNQMSVRFK